VVVERLPSQELLPVVAAELSLLVVNGFNVKWKLRTYIAHPLSKPVHVNAVVFHVEVQTFFEIENRFRSILHEYY
jgi:hypothetical protein